MANEKEAYLARVVRANDGWYAIDFPDLPDLLDFPDLPDFLV